MKSVNKKYAKKIMVWGLSLFLLSTILGGCGTDSSTTKEKVLRVGTNATFVPFEFKDEKNNGYQGYDIDLIEAVAKKMNTKIEYKNVSFDALIPSLKTNDIDIAVSGMTITEERKKNVLFSSPYYESGLALISKKKMISSDLTSLGNLKIAVQLGSTGANLAHKVEGAIVKEFDHSNEALLELKNGGADVVIVDLPVAQYYISQHSNEGFAVIPYVNGQKEYFGMAIKPGNEALQLEVNKALKELKDDGELDKIYEKWFHQKAPTDLPIGK